MLHVENVVVLIGTMVGYFLCIVERGEWELYQHACTQMLAFTWFGEDQAASWDLSMYAATDVEFGMSKSL
ncbi:hypothetical protein HBI56_130750 [Parastagonospora nodorum]|uniref:Uncharacterized protein n=1 Tax=Phaeosphaeria nodorum (strain SN15 / ATCC MYA-4574 / FGSC 10173) TaxID=321614 RepID=A0A7U2F0C2_PHANO|nr:hypothetical protein HBH56_153060 [Parastagonospora nodorum]QRC96037.1 hypothetical protein JI435_408220 [Parastagonospora nodorum SN15]KAH3926682.1 hypothetical protein HBH54_164620 [Parastagonospora nodorum]KAH3940312.1 hypothetical protein HBH53_217560 [Parastagonospora nodorum]KAH3970439.1 hypothetical protein HBH52_166260 [Parastagonospora nodorum]